MNKQVEANLSMVVSKALGGLNMNALKYLLPLWIAPVTGVTFRLVFGAAAFWLIDIFCKPENSTTRQKWQLFMLGALGIYGYMFFYLLGISRPLRFPVPFLSVWSLYGYSLLLYCFIRKK